MYRGRGDRGRMCAREGFKRLNDPDLCLGSLSRTLDRALLENMAAATIGSCAAAVLRRNTSGYGHSTGRTGLSAEHCAPIKHEGAYNYTVNCIIELLHLISTETDGRTDGNARE